MHEGVRDELRSDWTKRKKHKEDDVRKAGQVPRQIKLNKRRRIPINSVSDMAASIRPRGTRRRIYRMIADDTVN
jgi:hypothetical protein